MGHQYPGHLAVLDWLQANPESTVREVATALGMTTVVARSRLQNLRAAGEVTVAASKWRVVSQPSVPISHLTTGWPEGFGSFPLSDTIMVWRCMVHEGQLVDSPPSGQCLDATDGAGCQWTGPTPIPRLLFERMTQP